MLEPEFAGGETVLVLLVGTGPCGCVAGALLPIDMARSTHAKTERALQQLDGFQVDWL